MRHLPATETRVETGAVQFGDDWPGLFIRGDDCAAMAFSVQSIIRLIGNAGVDYALTIAPLRRLSTLIFNTVLGKWEPNEDQAPQEAPDPQDHSGQ